MKLFQDSQFYCMIVGLYISSKEMALNCVHGKNMDGLFKYLEILMFIKRDLTLAVICFCDILISALHGKRKESFIFLTLLFKSHSSAATLGDLQML